MNAADPLARALYENYRTSQRWLDAPAEAGKGEEAWETLSPEAMAAITRLAHEVRERLLSVGMAIVPAGKGPAPILGSDYAAVLEPLAQMAHIRWMNTQLAAKRKRIDRDPLHRAQEVRPELIPWEVMPDLMREGRRDEVRNLPRICAQAGLAIIQVARPTARPESAPDEPPEHRPLGAEDIEVLAQAIHASYVAHRLSEGETLTTNPALRPWERLAEPLQESNREAAWQLWHRMATLGYRIIRKGSEAAPVPQEELLSRLEILAEMGHMRWVNERIANGWTWSPLGKDLEQRKHPSLAPWALLPEVEREKNREQVRDLPAMLEQASLMVARAGR